MLNYNPILTTPIDDTIALMHYALMAMFIIAGVLLFVSIILTILALNPKKKTRTSHKIRLTLFYIVTVFVLACSLICRNAYISENNRLSNLPPETSEQTTTVETTTETTTEATTEATTIPPETEPPEFNITLSFAGDCMLASYLDQTPAGSFNEYAANNEPTYFLEKVRHIFENDDFTTVNLENVFSDRSLSPRKKDHDPAYWFKSKSSNVEILTSSSVEGVSLSNNHTYDYGNAGYNDTVQTVTEAGLKYGENSNIIYYEKEGFKIAVICAGLWWDGQSREIIRWLGTAEEQSDFQVVFYHGGTEKLHEPEEWKVRESRNLVDNGADLVIGNHPHVLQPREVYNGVEIIYSLGNFCYGGHSRPENRTIIYQLSLTIDKESLTVQNSNSSIIPCYVYTEDINNYQPAPIENEDECKMVLDFMEGLIDLPL